jgi:hypothetical protein
MASKKKRAKNAKKGSHKRRSVNPKKPRKRNASKGRRRNPSRRGRRRNPSGTGLFRAFLGGGVAHVVGSLAAEAGEKMLGHKRGAKTHSHAKAAIRLVGKLVPAGGAYLLNDDAKNPSPFVFGMMGGAGKGAAEEVVRHAARMASHGGGAPPEWARWLGAGGGTTVSLPDGSSLYHDVVQGPMLLPALAPGAMGPPAPIPLPPAAANGLVQISGKEFDCEDGRKMLAIGETQKGEIIIRDKATGQMDTMSGMTMDQLHGLVAVKGMVKLTGHGDVAEPQGLAGEDEDEDEEEDDDE